MHCPEEEWSLRQLWWIDTGWGCGGVFVKNGIVAGGAPIFRKLIGQNWSRLRYRYKTKGPLTEPRP